MNEVELVTTVERCVKLLRAGFYILGLTDRGPCELTLPGEVLVDYYVKREVVGELVRDVRAKKLAGAADDLVLEFLIEPGCAGRWSVFSELNTDALQYKATSEAVYAWLLDRLTFGE